MCEVCAVFGVGRHWTDAASLANAEQPAPDIARYRAERRRRVRVINGLLQSAGITVSDWDGESYWVARVDGRGERAADLAQVWAVAGRLAARSFDPLSVDFLPQRT